MGGWLPVVTALLVSAALIQKASSSATDPACKRTLDIALIFDASPSLCGNDDKTRTVHPTTKLVHCDSWDQIRRFARLLIDELQISGPGSTRVAAIRYAREPLLMWNLDRFTTKEDLRNEIVNMEYGVREDDLGRKNSRNTADALRMTADYIFGFRTLTAGSRKVAILITGGKSDYKQEQTVRQAKHLKDQDVNVHVVGVNNEINDINETEIMLISSLPQIKNQNWFLTNFHDVAIVLNRLLRIACCDLVKAKERCQLDIVFIVDRSGSICDNDTTRTPQEKRDSICNNWRTVRNFMVNVTRLFQIGTNSTRVAVVVFGSNTTAGTRMLWDLNKYTTDVSLEAAIRRIPYKSENTFTAGGLRIAKDEVFTKKGGDRDGVENIAIVITDGKSTTGNETTIDTADQLKRAGVNNKVTVYTIGVTDSIGETELKKMSSYPHVLNQNYFKTPNFKSLSVVLKTIERVACCPPVSVTPEERKCFMDLAFIIDASGSICDTDQLSERKMADGSRTCNNWVLLKSFLNRMVRELSKKYNDPRVRTKFACLVFSDQAKVIFNFNSFNSSAAMLDTIQNIRLEGGRTNTPAAFRTARTDIFQTSVGDRPETSEGGANVAIVITDGIPCPPDAECPPGVKSFTQQAITEARDLERERRVKILSIGVTNSIDRGVLANLSSSPHEEGKTFWRTPSFKILITHLDNLIDEACKHGDNTTKCSRPVDVVFVVDTSGSIGRANFEKTQQFLIDVINTLDVESGNASVGLISFATRERLIFHLHTHYKNKAAMRRAISSMQYTRGKTNTGAALKYMTDFMFAPSGGDRPSVPNLAFVITDGGSQDKKFTTEEAIRAKTTKDIHIISVGVGGWTDQDELRAIASHPYRDNYLPMKNYDELLTRFTGFHDIICRNNDPCKRLGVCLNGGTCENVFDGYRCKCPSPYAGKQCEYACRKPADVALAIDASGSIGKKNFQKIIDFSIDLLDNLPLDSTGQAAMETYSDDAKIYFHLDSFTGRKRRILNAMTIPYFQGRSTATDIALSKMRDPLFKRGNNPNAPNVGIVITDGKSNNKSETWNQARLTRAEDNLLLAIGVGGNIRHQEMQAIASWPVDNNIFTVSDFNALPDILHRVRDAVCDSVDNCWPNPCQNSGACVDTINGYYCVCTSDYTGKHCERHCTGSADILFIIDKSGSIRNERFSEVKDFVNNIIMELEVWRGKVQIAAVSFDNTAMVEFRLNTYRSKQDIMQAIRFMNYGGGRTNIADALKLAREDIFRQEYGDRQQAPNFIIAFTDGNSNINRDRTISEAVQTRISGAHILTVGVGTQINMFEMIGIASNPSSKNIFTTRSFNTLQSLVSSVYNGICNDIYECASNPCRNGGSCLDGLRKYVCFCDSDWTGTNCERRCQRQLDVAFVVDLSGSVENVYNLSVAFVRHVVSGLDFRFKLAQAALVGYSTDAKVEFYLNSYTEKMDVENAIAFQNRTGGRTNTEEALRLVRYGVLQNNRGARYNVKKAVVLLTDGGSNINPQNTVPMADSIKATGSDIYVVAIGDKVDMGEVNNMASTPAEPWVMRLGKQSEVEDKANLFLDHVCQ